jgi:hypothetical protein
VVGHDVDDDAEPVVVGRLDERGEAVVAAELVTQRPGSTTS